MAKIEPECINSIMKYMGTVQDIKIALHTSITHEFGKGRGYLIDKKNKALKELRISCNSPDIKDIF
jgi:hypothetical protein